MLEYSKVLVLDPNHVDVQFALGGLYLNRGNLKMAVECWKKYLHYAPAGTPKSRLAEEYLTGAAANKVTIGKYIAE